MGARMQAGAIGGVAVLSIAILTTGPLYRVRTWWSYEDPLSADPVVVTLYAAIGLLGGVVLATEGRWKRIDRIPGVAAVSLVVWLGLTAFWSSDPGRTLRDALFILAALAAGAALACIVSGEVFLLLVWIGLHLGLAWSAVAIRFTFPGSQGLYREWTGIFFNRNSLGLYAALGILTCVLLAVELLRHRPRPAAKAAGIAVLASAAFVDAILLRGSQAVTPRVALAGAVAAMLFAAAARRFVVRGLVAASSVVAIGGLAIVAVGVAFWMSRGPLLRSLGRRGDLTSRVELWEKSWSRFTDRPLIGHGYLSAWSDAAFQRQLESTVGAGFDSAHNSFFEVLLGSGVVGIVLLAAAVLGLYVHVARQAVATAPTWRAWPLGLFCFVLIENLTETLLVGGQLVVAILGALMVVPHLAPAGRARSASSFAQPRRSDAGVPKMPSPAGFGSAPDRP